MSDLLLMEKGERIANLGDIRSLNNGDLEGESLEYMFGVLKEKLINQFMTILMMKKMDMDDYENATTAINTLNDDVEDVMWELINLGKSYMVSSLIEEDNLHVTEDI